MYFVVGGVGGRFGLGVEGVSFGVRDGGELTPLVIDGGGGYGASFDGTNQPTPITNPNNQPQV